VSTKKSEKKSDEQSLLEVARKRFDLAVEAESAQRKESLEDLKFRAGEQWPENIKHRALGRR
jgi:hypothetical protein